MAFNRESCARAIIVVGVVIAFVGCSSSDKGASDAAVSLDMANPCKAGATVPLASFESGLQHCYATFAEAMTQLDCLHQTADCTGYHVFGIPGPYVQWDCVYDATSGNLAGADYFNDEGMSCIAGVQPSSCGFTGYAHGDVCPDGGN